MKMTTLEKWILLEQSGELSARKTRRLNACPEANAKRAALKALTSAVRNEEVEPSPWTTQKIATRLRNEPQRRWMPTHAWQPILAIAACLTLVVGLFNLKPETSASSVGTAKVVSAELDVWDVQFEEDLVELENLIRVLSGDPLDIMEM